MIQKHPKLMTYYAQAYRIKCLYNTGERPIDVGFNVSMLTTAGTIANTGPPPTCTMRICNANGDDISQVSKRAIKILQCNNDIEVLVKDRFTRLN